MTQQLPSVFVGSSSEGLDVAREVELQLQRDAVTTLWKDSVFGLGYGVLESLMNALDQFDFAVMILSPDDLLESRRESYASPRDNVIFELGLFMGRLGRSRTFIVHAADSDLKLPSDLAGITVSPYRQRDNLAAALSPACTPIIKAIRSLGFSELRLNSQLNEVKQKVQEHDEVIDQLVTYGLGFYPYQKLKMIYDGHDLRLEKNNPIFMRHIYTLMDHGLIQPKREGELLNINDYHDYENLPDRVMPTPIGRMLVKRREAKNTR